MPDGRNQLLIQLLVLVVLTRTLFLGYHYGPEARYIVEAYPAMIAACGVTGAALWRTLTRSLPGRRKPEQPSGQLHDKPE